jgi:hypothetical protein
MRILLLIAVCLDCSGQDAAALLKRSDEASQVNEKKAAQYTYIEETSHFKIDDKTGGKKLESTETFDVMTLEGDSYKKLIARNGKPLSAKEAANEEKKFKQTAAERRRNQNRNGLFHHSFTFGVSKDDQLKFFDCSLAEQLEIRGHRTQAVECIPKSSYTPKNKHEKDAMNFKTKTFIDLEEGIPVRFVFTVIGSETPLKLGSNFSIDFEKINDDAWLPSSGVFDVHVQFSKLMKDSSYDESRDSNYRKFEANSTVVDAH